ncbi:hypothetical protein [Rufibacter roseolus]|uniref:hypothetical protein n=1 Tax=Rufibacter roseolus TaxID=2817375 RepID=UPI001B313575|nr:hypothetical protein [Rufibacter roseolus]
MPPDFPEMLLADSLPGIVSCQVQVFGIKPDNDRVETSVFWLCYVDILQESFWKSLADTVEMSIIMLDLNSSTKEN